MDSRLIFLHYRNSIKTEGGTQTVSRRCNGLNRMVKGDLERQIRQIVCQEKPLRRVR
jgi:hypothetical protein